MATEHTSPPVVRKRRPAGHTATVAAAPLFVLLALLAASSRLPVAAAGLTQPTLVAGAQEKGAVCLDGTPPAYYLQKGFGSGSQSWMVFLEISTTGIKFLYIIAMGHHFLGTRRVKQRMEPNCISEDCAPGKQLSLNSWKKEWTLLNRPYLQAVLPEVYPPYCTVIIFVQGFLKRFQSNALLMVDSFLMQRIYQEKGLCGRSSMVLFSFRMFAKFYLRSAWKRRTRQSVSSLLDLSRASAPPRLL